MNAQSYNIYHNFEVKSDARRVFEAFSEPKHLVHWWPQKCEGTPQLGGVYNLFFTEEYDWQAEVVRNEPYKSIYFSMLKSDQDWASTTFGIDLEEKADSTYVRFFHKDWPEENDHFKHSSFCWALLLKGLKNYVEKGVIIPFEDRA